MRQFPLSLSVIVPVYNEKHLVHASITGLLAVEEHVKSLQIVIVDDRSRDGSWDVVQDFARLPNVVLTRHEVNQGKGAAIRTGLSYCTGDITLVHDADLEYDPRDIPQLLVPFVEAGADAVYGSRYISAAWRRALLFKHSMMNRFLTFLSNLASDLDLTDMETCYKAVKTPLLKSIPLRSNDFRIEVELTLKLAKRRAMVYEVPIRYSPRSYEEGKKIRAKDGLLALAALARFYLVDDIWQRDQYGSHILNELQHARRFNKWMGDTLRPHLGDRILEIGAGVGNLTSQLIPREAYFATDINPNYLAYLDSFRLGKPYLQTGHLDANVAEDYRKYQGRVDTVLLINVLEHLVERDVALKSIFDILPAAGRFIVLVPQHPALYGSLDAAIDHQIRYTRDGLIADMRRAGFEVEKIFDFNRVAVPGWWFNGRVLGRKTFSRFQLKVLETIMPAVARVDPVLPWSGLSLIAVGVKPGPVAL